MRKLFFPPPPRLFWKGQKPETPVRKPTQARAQPPPWPFGKKTPAHGPLLAWAFAERKKNKKTTGPGFLFSIGLVLFISGAPKCPFCERSRRPPQSRAGRRLFAPQTKNRRNGPTKGVKMAAWVSLKIRPSSLKIGPLTAPVFRRKNSLSTQTTKQQGERKKKKRKKIKKRSRSP